MHTQLIYICAICVLISEVTPERLKCVTLQWLRAVQHVWHNPPAGIPGVRTVNNTEISLAYICWCRAMSAACHRLSTHGLLAARWTRYEGHMQVVHTEGQHATWHACLTATHTYTLASSPLHYKENHCLHCRARILTLVQSLCPRLAPACQLHLQGTQLP